MTAGNGKQPQKNAPKQPHPETEYDEDQEKQAKYAPNTEGSKVADSPLLDVTVRLEGRTAMLHNRISQETLELLRDKSNKKSKTATKPIPRVEAEGKAYFMEAVPGKKFLTLEDKRQVIPYVPVENLFSCLAVAGRSVRMEGKRQMSTAKSTTLPAYLALMDSHLPLCIPGQPGVPAPFETDMRAGKNPHGGELVCIVRPRFDRWMIDVDIQIDTEEIPEQAIRKLFDIAGSRVGLCDFRPSCRGPFGRFRVTSWVRSTDADAVKA